MIKTTVPVPVLCTVAVLLCSGAAPALADGPGARPTAPAPAAADGGGVGGGSLAPGPDEPFAWGASTWLNGNNRQHAALLDSKYFTGSFLADVNYVWDWAHPIDHTLVGSTATFRTGEFNLSFLGVGGDFHWENARGRIMLQLGTRATS